MSLYLIEVQRCGKPKILAIKNKESLLKMAKRFWPVNLKA